MDFYRTLITQCRTAKHRIVWSTLYLGHGIMSKNLIDELKNNSFNNPELEVELRKPANRRSKCSST